MTEHPENFEDWARGYGPPSIVRLFIRTVRLDTFDSITPSFAGETEAEAHIQELVDAFQTGRYVPPLSIHRGRLSDGNHRLVAARRLNRETIEVFNKDLFFRYPVPSTPKSPRRSRVHEDLRRWRAGEFMNRKNR
jgi:hypothetical protein